VVRFFVRVRVIRHQAEVIQVGCDSFQHADHPRPIESDRPVSFFLSTGTSARLLQLAQPDCVRWPSATNQDRGARPAMRALKLSEGQATG
jgi:hypothetical protein